MEVRNLHCLPQLQNLDLGMFEEVSPLDLR